MYETETLEKIPHLTGTLQRKLTDLQKAYMDRGSYPVSYELEEIRDQGLTSIVADVMSEKGNKIRHDEDKLGRLLMELM
jgi:hypothetical protein